jgi:hypothetical protein
MTKGKNANLRFTSKIFETGKFASSKSKFKKPAKFHNFLKFQQKTSDNFVRRKLKVNSILTSLDLSLSNFSSFRLHFISGDFLVDLLSRTHSQAFSVKFCQMSGVRRNNDFFNVKHLIMMKNDQSYNFLLKTGDILNFRFFEETTILQELSQKKWDISG